MTASLLPDGFNLCVFTDRENPRSRLTQGREIAVEVRDRLFVLAYPRTPAYLPAIDTLISVKWMMMAAAMVDAMSQSNGFQARRKEDVDNKDNLWYVLCYD